MALEGIDYNTDLQDIIWNNATGGPSIVTLDNKVCRDLVELLWVRTDFTTLVGRPNISTLVKTQQFQDEAMAILSARQATQSNLDIREQIINFNISPVTVVRQTPVSIEWKVTIEFRSGEIQSQSVIL